MTDDEDTGVDTPASVESADALVADLANDLHRLQMDLQALWTHVRAIEAILWRRADHVDVDQLALAHTIAAFYRRPLPLAHREAARVDGALAEARGTAEWKKPA